MLNFDVLRKEWEDAQISNRSEKCHECIYEGK
jgi:hypothetical protein